jgi:hypothetical protein
MSSKRDVNPYRIRLLRVGTLVGLSVKVPLIGMPDFGNCSMIFATGTGGSAIVEAENVEETDDMSTGETSSSGGGDRVSSAAGASTSSSSSGSGKCSAVNVSSSAVDVPL